MAADRPSWFAGGRGVHFPSLWCAHGAISHARALCGPLIRHGVRPHRCAAQIRHTCGPLHLYYGSSDVVRLVFWGPMYSCEL